MELQEIALLVIKVMFTTTVIIDITQAPTTMYDKLQQMIFGDVPTKELPYLFTCSVCMTFWWLLTTLILSDIGILDSLLYSSIGAYCVPFMKELLLGLQDRLISILSKV